MRTEATKVTGIVVDVFQDLGIRHWLKGLLPADGVPAIPIPNGIGEDGKQITAYHCLKLKPNQFTTLREEPIEAK